MRRMPRSARRARPGRSGTSNRKGAGDWSDNLSGMVWRVFTRLRDVKEVVEVAEKFAPSETEESLHRLEKMVKDIAPGTHDQKDVLDGIRQVLEWSTEQQKQSQAKLLGTLQEFLDRSTEQYAQAQETHLQGLEGLFAQYHRTDLLNQLTGVFACAEAVKQITRLADQAEKIAGSLASINENLKSINAQGGYFPEHVHSYVKMMIEQHANDAVPHYFTVFDRGTLWYAAFAKLQRNDPLGQRYLGHRSDLDELCAFLADEVRPNIGNDAVIHILMPTMEPLAITEAVRFPDEMHPFRVDGELGPSGTPFVWMCVPEEQDRKCLRHIGILNQREIWVWKGLAGIALPVIYQWLTVPVGPQYFIDPGFRLHTEVSLVLICGAYVFLGPEPARTLGEPCDRPW